MMNMKKWLCVFLALALLLGATGCAPEAASNTDPTETDTGKVEDPFAQPSEDPDAETSAVGDANQPFEQFFGFGWSTVEEDVERGFDVNYVYDEKTTMQYRVYDGGEMRLPFYLLTQGYEADGFGVLLFVDGLPQPYRMEGDTEYSYMHAFYPEDGEYYLDLYFIPVTGQAGDNLEVWALLVFGPECFPTKDNPYTRQYAMGSVMAEQRIQFNAAPPAQELPEASNRILSQTVSYEDTSFSDISGWSVEDLQTKISSICTTPDMDDRTHMSRYDISADTPIQLRFEVYGSPLVDYRLVYFLDYVPVAVSIEDLAFIEIESGRKTIVETTVDLSGFDGYSILFPVLVPVNRILTDDGEVQANTLYLRAQVPFQFILTAASDYQGMLDMNSNRR